MNQSALASTSFVNLHYVADGGSLRTVGEVVLFVNNGLAKRGVSKQKTSSLLAKRGFVSILTVEHNARKLQNITVLPSVRFLLGAIRIWNQLHVVEHQVLNRRKLGRLKIEPSRRDTAHSSVEARVVAQLQVKSDANICAINSEKVEMEPLLQTRAYRFDLSGNAGAVDTCLSG